MSSYTIVDPFEKTLPYSLTNMHPRNTVSKIAFLVALQLSCVNSHAQGAPVGVFDRVTGQVSVQTPGNPSRLASRGDAVAVGDVVVTDDTSEAGITASDGTRIVLRVKSRLEVTDYRFEPANNNAGTFVTNLLRGGLRMVTGLIGKAQPRNQRVLANTATIGIRGTDFEVVMVDDDTADLRAGTYDHVFDGATDISLASGETLVVPKDKTGLALANPRPGEERLQLLDSRPAFIRGGGFDAMQLLQTRPQMIIRPMR